MVRYTITSANTVIWTRVMPLNNPKMKPCRSRRWRRYAIPDLATFTTPLWPRRPPSMSLLLLPLFLAHNRNAPTVMSIPVITHQSTNLCQSVSQAVGEEVYGGHLRVVHRPVVHLPVHVHVSTVRNGAGTRQLLIAIAPVEDVSGIGVVAVG
jgi:hypothetical protein